MPGRRGGWCDTLNSRSSEHWMAIFTHLDFKYWLKYVTEYYTFPRLHLSNHSLPFFFFFFLFDKLAYLYFESSKRCKTTCRKIAEIDTMLFVQVSIDETSIWSRCNSPCLDTNFLPWNTGHYLLCVNAVLVLDGKIEQWVQKWVRKKVRFKSQFNKFSVLGVVVMFLRLYSWVWHRNALNIKAKLLPSFCNKVRKVIDRKPLSELIEDPKLTRLCRICDGKLNTLNSVSYVKECPGLNTLKKKKKTN